MSRSPIFPGLRVFLVEDESVVAMLVELMLEELECTVAASAASVSEALAAMKEIPFDLALLDVNLQGERVYPVADALLDQNVPICFGSGYGTAGIPERLRRWPVLTKPFRQDQLAIQLELALELGRTP